MGDVGSGVAMDDEYDRGVGGRFVEMIVFFFFQAEDGIRDSDM